MLYYFAATYYYDLLDRPTYYLIGTLVENHLFTRNNRHRAIDVNTNILKQQFKKSKKERKRFKTTKTTNVATIATILFSALIHDDLSQQQTYIPIASILPRYHMHITLQTTFYQAWYVTN